MTTLTAATTAGCKQYIEVMLAIFPCLKLHIYTKLQQLNSKLAAIAFKATRQDRCIFMLSSSYKRNLNYCRMMLHVSSNLINLIKSHARTE